MKKYLKQVSIFIGFLLFYQSVLAGLLFNYSQLALKDLDQMNKIVKAKIAESRKAGGNKAIPLKEALQAVFCRSNEDFMIEKLLPSIKVQLDELDEWEPSIKALTKEAIGALKNPKPFQPVVLVSYQIFLENIISEMKPRYSEDFEGSVLRQIRDAKIELPQAMVHERKLRVMRESVSPSVIAEKVIKEMEDAAKKESSKASEKEPTGDALEENK